MYGGTREYILINSLVCALTGNEKKNKHETILSVEDLLNISDGSLNKAFDLMEDFKSFLSRKKFSGLYGYVNSLSIYSYYLQNNDYIDFNTFLGIFNDSRKIIYESIKSLEEKLNFNYISENNTTSIRVFKYLDLRNRISKISNLDDTIIDGVINEEFNWELIVLLLVNYKKLSRLQIQKISGFVGDKKKYKFIKHLCNKVEPYINSDSIKVNYGSQ